MIGAGTWPSLLVPVALLLVIGVTAWFTRRQTLRMSATPDNATAAGMLRLAAWLPFLSVVVSAFLPLAAVLYVTTSTVWTFAERTILRRVLPGGALRPAPQA